MWAVVEAQDENGSGEMLTHILPVVKVDGFETEKEAWDLLDRVGKAAIFPGNPPCITDENDSIKSTYFGHCLSVDCPCKPKRDGVDPGLYIHNATQ